MSCVTRLVNSFWEGGFYYFECIICRSTINDDVLDDLKSLVDHRTQATGNVG